MVRNSKTPLIAGALIPLVGIVIYFVLYELKIKGEISIKTEALDNIYFYPVCAGFGLISIGIIRLIKDNVLKYILRAKSIFWGFMFILWGINEFINLDNIVRYLSIICGGLILCIILFFIYRHNRA